MKLLRQTIRKLLVENESHYEKLLNMICSKKMNDINTGIMLAYELDYIGEYTYKEETHYDSRSHTWMFHEWDEAFLGALQDRNLFSRPGKGVKTKTWESGQGPNGFSASITYIEHPPYK